jgi:Zn finger protein HypA/HybF involved in hydrogenase expression
MSSLSSPNCSKILANNMLIRKILSNELTALIVALICCYLVADFVAQIICEKIEARQAKTQGKLLADLSYRDAELEALLKENLGLTRELELFKKEAVTKEAKKLINEKKEIIQCDKCYNEYDAANIQTSYIVQNIRQHYCYECFHRVTEKKNKQQHLKKSKSDSQFKYINN